MKRALKDKILKDVGSRGEFLVHVNDKHKTALASMKYGWTSDMRCQNIIFLKKFKNKFSYKYTMSPCQRFLFNSLIGELTE